MVDTFIFRFALLLLAVSPVVGQTSNICNFYYSNSDIFIETNYYSYLFFKLEEALIKDHKQLEELRTTFMSSSAALSLDIDASMSAKNVVNNICDYARDRKHDTLTFCPAGPHNWGLCNNCSLYMTLVQKQFSSLKLTATEMSIFQLITYICLMHGSLLGVYWPNYIFSFLLDEEYIFKTVRHKIRLKLDSLTCNPSCALTQCVVSEMFSWVS